MGRGLWAGEDGWGTQGDVQLHADFLAEVVAVHAVLDEGLQHVGVVLLGGVGVGAEALGDQFVDAAWGMSVDRDGKRHRAEMRPITYPITAPRPLSSPSRGSR